MEQTTRPHPVQNGGAATIVAEAPAERPADGEAISPCPNCGEPMNGIRGSKSAVCQNCGFKDSCCF